MGQRTTRFVAISPEECEVRKQLLGICLIAGLLVSVSAAPLLGQMKEQSLYLRITEW